ncbi:MAG: serine hydrolase domain-containing protein [Caldilineaceae bacterium]
MTQSAALISAVENNLFTTPTYRLDQQKPTASLAARMAHYHVPGVSVAIIHDNRIAWAKGYGYVNADTGVPVTPDTRFYAASISKPVTAMATLALVADSVLALDEDVNRKLIGWHVPDNEFTTTEKVTVRRLLSHSAGIYAGFYHGYEVDEPMPMLPQLLHGEPPSNSGAVYVQFTPGSRTEYSGSGYWVLQQLLEDVTSRSFADLLQATIFDKVGMTHSTFHSPLPEHHARVSASGHKSDGQPCAERSSRFPALADGGLWSTPSDLARFLIEVQLSAQGQSNRVLSPAMSRLMVTEELEQHSLGLHIFGQGDALRISHGGSGEAFLCLMAAFPAHGHGAVVMTNGANGWGLIMELFRSLAEVYDWPDYRAIGKHPISVAPGLLDSYEGQYRLVENIKHYGDYTGQWQVNHMPEVLFTVQSDGEGLLIRDPVQNEFHYYAQTDNSFFAVESDGDIKFGKDASGQVSYIDLVFSHASFRAKRVSP